MNYNTRTFVLSHLAREGENRDKLSLNEWIAVYLQGDGLGKITEESASESCYDWSHVRDSSLDGFRAMAEMLMAILRHKHAIAEVTRTLAEFDAAIQAGIEPTVRRAEWIIISDDEHGMEFLLPVDR